MLSDERLDDGERLTGSRRTDDPCSSKRIGYIHPALTELTLIVVTHGDIHGILVIHQLLILFKALILEIEAVFHQACLQMLGDIIQSRMYKERSEYRCYHVYPDVCPDSIEPCGHVPAIDPDGQHHQCQSCCQGEIHHLLCIELNMLLVPSSYAGNEYQQQCYELTVYEIVVFVDGKLCQAVVKVQHQRSHGCQRLIWHGIHEELNE